MIIDWCGEKYELVGKDYLTRNPIKRFFRWLKGDYEYRLIKMGRPNVSLYLSKKRFNSLVQRDYISFKIKSNG